MACDGAYDDVAKNAVARRAEQSINLAMVVSSEEGYGINRILYSSLFNYTNVCLSSSEEGHCIE